MTGQLGRGEARPAYYRPGKITTAGASPNTAWLQVTAGMQFTLALRTDHSLWAWGNSASGILGNGSTSPDAFRPIAVPTPASATAGTYWTAVTAGRAFALALRSDGTLWAWGYSGYGALGLGTPTATLQLTPKQVLTPVASSPGTTWTQVAAGYEHTLALRSDGTLWSWGSNEVGQLGVGNNTRYFEPQLVPIPPDSDLGAVWLQAVAGSEHSLALRSDSTLWGWGRNTEGQLGDNSAINRVRPVQEFTHGHWRGASAGITHSLALGAQKVFAAGGLNYNLNFGQIGDGTRNGSAYFRAVLAPVLVPVLTTKITSQLLTLCLWPNPARTTLQVTGFPAAGVLYIYDAHGCMHYQHPIVATSTMHGVNVNAFVPGIYLVQYLTTTGQRTISRFVVE